MCATNEAKRFVLKLDSYDGDDSFLHCGVGEQDHMFCIVSQMEEEGLEIVDSGYRSISEALASWPDAKPCC